MATQCTQTRSTLHSQGRFFHGFYGCCCYLPLYIFCGEHLLCARLRPPDVEASAGAPERESSGQPARLFRFFTYRTRDT